MSETPETARYAIIDHVVHLVNRDYEAMATDYYKLEFLDESVDVKPIVPALANFFDDVLEASVEELMFKDDVFRWNRLENLLREGSKNSDFNAEDVLPPLLDLALENESGENTLRPLIEKETIKVIEALMLTSENDIEKHPNLIPLVDALPAQIKSLPPITISGSVAQKKDLERTRDSV